MFKLDLCTFLPWVSVYPKDTVTKFTAVFLYVGENFETFSHPKLFQIKNKH